MVQFEKNCNRCSSLDIALIIALSEELHIKESKLERVI